MLARGFSFVLALLLAFAALRPALACDACKPCCKPAAPDHASLRAKMSCCEPGRVVEPLPQPPSHESSPPVLLAAAPVTIFRPAIIAGVVTLPVAAPQRTMPLFQRLLL